jgi:tRNA (Thr-GGU) A37 N-methylase
VADSPPPWPPVGAVRSPYLRTEETPIQSALNPAETGEQKGVFATRSPRRPTPIGLSLVSLVSVTDSGFTFAGVDVMDGTPVLDVKPYVAAFDLPQGEVRSGWFDDVDPEPGTRPMDLGPA